MSAFSPFRMRLQATAACIGGAVLWWRLGGYGCAILASAFVVLAVLAWVSPRRYAPIQRLLDAVVHLLISVCSWVLLGLVYFLVFTPARIISSLLGRNPLHCQLSSGTISNLKTLPLTGADHFKRQY